MADPKQAFVDLLASVPAEKVEEFRSFVLSKFPEPSSSSSSSVDAASASSPTPAEKAKKTGGKKKDASKPGKMTPDIAKREAILDNVVFALRDLLPVDALAPNEKDQLVPSHNPDYEGMDKNNTVHVDNFLFDGATVDDLCDEGKIARNYCGDCGSKNIIPMNFISHSLSREVIQWIFGAVLGNLGGKIVVDVGSRMGPILYTGHLFSNAKQLIGVEINPFWVSVQRAVVDGFEMGDRVKLIEGDISNNLAVLETANVVFLHNVFEWFCSVEEQRKKWTELLGAIKKECRIVASPSIESSLEKIGLTLAEVAPKLQKNKVPYPKPRKGEEDDEFFEDCREVHMYTMY